MTIQFWRNRDRYYRLIGVKCADCGEEYFPPVYTCRKCGSTSLKDSEMPKKGRILTYTHLYETLPGFELQVPLCLAVVELENGVRVLGQIVNTSIEEIQIGRKVRAVFRRIKVDGESGQILYGYKFALEEDDGSGKN